MQDLRKHKAKMAASRLFSLNPWNKHYPCSSRSARIMPGR